MLKFYDIALTITHIVLIFFNLFGWIFPYTRRVHLIIVIVTWFSWIVLGIWFGFGYCPLTDLQWKIKERLGETDLPASFITYAAEAISGREFPDPFIDAVTGICFITVTFLTVFFNMRKV